MKITNLVLNERQSKPGTTANRQAPNWQALNLEDSELKEDTVSHAVSTGSSDAGGSAGLEFKFSWFVSADSIHATVLAVWREREKVARKLLSILMYDFKIASKAAEHFLSLLDAGALWCSFGDFLSWPDNPPDNPPDNQDLHRHVWVSVCRSEYISRCISFAGYPSPCIARGISFAMFQCMNRNES